MAGSTQESYGVGQRKLIAFASKYNKKLTDVLPSDSNTLHAFVVFLFTYFPTLQHKSAKAYLSHVRKLHVLLALSTEGFQGEQVKATFDGYKRLRPSKERAAKRLPLTISILHDIVALFQSSQVWADHLLMAALCVGVYGLFRSGELAVKSLDGSPLLENLLSRSNVRWETDYVAIRLDVSKSDPFREGVEIVLHKNNTPTCPYNRLRYIWDHSPLTGSFDPLFQLEDGSPLEYIQLNEAIKVCAIAIGLDPKSFSGHSMRIGGATSLAILGYDAHVIKTLGRWKSLSYQLFTRMTMHMRAEISRKLGSPASVREVNYFGGVDPNVACSLSFDGFVSTLSSPRRGA
jgi:hypothetical protein